MAISFGLLVLEIRMPYRIGVIIAGMALRRAVRYQDRGSHLSLVALHQLAHPTSTLRPALRNVLGLFFLCQH